MSEAPLLNDAAARTETGEIKDQSQSPPTTTEQKPTETTEQKPTETKQETKTEETKPDDKSSLLNKGEKDKKEEPTGAPEKYENWKVPEGYEIPADSTKQVNELFKDLNLSQSQGQKLVDAWIKSNQEAEAAPYKAWEDMQAKWVDQVKLDPEMGSKLNEIRSTINKALDGLGDEKLSTEFRQAMDLTGAGNNPAFVKAFWKLAQQVTEGGFVSGKGPSPFGQKAPGSSDRPTAAKSLYPNLA